MRKLVVIRLDANHKVGMGHLFRMKILANVFNNNNFKCVFLLHENIIASNILDKTLHEYLLFPLEYSEEDIIENYFSNHYRPDLWIFDILTTKKKWIKNIKKNNVPVVCFDDLDGGLFFADMVINAINGCWDENKALEAKFNNLFTGPKYAIINPSLLKLTVNKILIKDKLNIAISMGGSDTYGSTLRVGRILSETKDMNLNATFFLGPHFLHEDEFEKEIKKIFTKYTIKRNVKYLYKELVKNDVVICGGGHTLFELSAIGVPALVLANEPHEEKTIAFFAEKKACIDIGSIHKKILKEKLQSFIKDFYQNKDLIIMMQENAKRLVDGKGTSRCYNKCLKLVFKT